MATPPTPSTTRPAPSTTGSRQLDCDDHGRSAERAPSAYAVYTGSRVLLGRLHARVPVDGAYLYDPVLNE
jgi:hypothetical protein